MRKTLTAIAALGAATGLLVSGTVANAGTRAEKGEARLQKMLEGRVAGEPQSCITTLGSDRLQVIDGTAIVYDGGKTIYVARPTSPGQLSSSDVLVIERHNGMQLCTTDIIKTMDRSAGFMTGVVFLDKFVPYTKSDMDK
ncbi:hypothetical protein MB02_08295 [Croceicoccus estronivorus]|uniref:hypothetical protein n=1 Tax=Croceicoccus estronivorus TaxID=1172626 RepID=UPI00083449D9|nr:hypothetical protein [Croceicoccus estronivorus]OCC23826.1 hypothetical protein MB02_08295 [Croceicoccus estronivorus]